MKKHIYFTAFLFFIYLIGNSQKSISVEDIYTNGLFYPQSAAGFNALNNGLEYTDIISDSATGNNLVKFDLKTGNKIATIVKAKNIKFNGLPIDISNYSFSSDETKILFSTNSESIYRRSEKSLNFVYDIKTETLRELSSNGKQMFATISPKGNKVAFVRDNNLFIKNLNLDKEIQITFDGKNNEIKNGWADWVYEEEFSKANYFEWNADGSKLAYVRFDERNVKEYTFDAYNNNLYPDKITFKYPKAGEDNSIVSVHVYDLLTLKTATVDIGKETDIYIPRIKWTNDANTLSISRLNRLQNNVELLYANAMDGSTKIILTETSKTYIDVTDDLTFLSNDKGFIWSSEQDNYNHLYHYDNNGKLITQITKGNWDVISFYGIDEKSNTLFYQSTQQGAINRDLYSIKLNGTSINRLSPKDGTTEAEFTKGLKYYVSKYSNANTPPVYELHQADGKLIKILQANESLKKLAADYQLSAKEFFTFKNKVGTELNGWLMKPSHFNPSKTYPVLMVAYNGPGSNKCNNMWETFDMWWHSILNQEGYIVVCVDGRGTLGRGREFKHSTYLQLGKLEVEDQIDANIYIGNLPYVDKKRIGFMGWSYGGYLASLLISKGADYFKTAVAIAPVTNWKFYDNIYTERFLRKPIDNKSGYEDNSPINFTHKIKGKFLLIHGSGDDNVHYQNSMELARELVNNNIPFEFMTYPNKNHGIYGGYTRIHLFNKIQKFIKENL
ncbi:MAG: S9 family peptidase [Bacteroidota bacterium]|jgi:dipeptidyl-peptidase-4